MNLETDFLGALSRLVEINTVSPMSDDAITELDSIFCPIGFHRQVDKCFWIRKVNSSKLWIYCHVDTKPAGDLSQWLTPPFKLTSVEDRLCGRGVSDAKFQLLNALLKFSSLPVNFIIDGAEECSGREVGKFISQEKIDDLAIVDGTSEDGREIYSGLRGQLDGQFTLGTGCEPLHPGRRPRSEILLLLKDLLRKTEGHHFNVTRIAGGEWPRSLTLETIEVGFDIRYSPEDSCWAMDFVEQQKAKLKQHFPPIFGQETLRFYPLASFSNPLGMEVNEIRRLWVLPGGRPNNKAHRPNEFIYKDQIEKHRTMLQGFAESYFNMLSNTS